MADSPIARVGTVFLPVADQARAAAFYRDVLGFDVVTDVAFGTDETDRWVEVAPPGAATVVALNGPGNWGGEGAGPGGMAPFAFHTDDFDATLAQLEARGVPLEERIGGEGPVPPMVFFHDVDGNRVLLVQRTD